MPATKVQERTVGREELEGFMGSLFGDDIHAQRLASLTNGVDGVLHAASLGVTAIGQGLAVAQGLTPRHAIKQVDRLLSNRKLDRVALSRSWVAFVVGQRKELFVNFDWTELDSSDQSILVLGTQTQHGRSTPLLWKTVTRSELKGKRNDHEDELLLLFSTIVPEGVRVTVVADRGFSDSKLYAFLTEELGFDYIIRFRGVVTVEDARGERRKAREWLGKGGRMRVLRHAAVTARRHEVPVVVCVRQKAMALRQTWGTPNHLKT